MDNDPITFTTEESNLAASQEESERLSAENRHLQQRVVLLRALVNRLQSENPKPVEDGVKEETPPEESSDN